MTLEIKRGANETTIKVVGRLDSFTSPALEKMINRISSGTSCIVLEMSGLEQVSDNGISVLLSAHEKMSAIGSLRLTGVGKSVMEKLKESGCADILSIS